MAKELSYAALVYALIQLSFMEIFGNGNFIDWAKIRPNICADHENFEYTTKDTVIDVYYKIVITDLFDVSEERMEFGLQLFVFDIWRDPLINFTKEVDKIQQSVPKDVAECLWKPDLTFPNCKKMELYKVTVPNTILKIIYGGYIFRYSRFNLVVSCQMEFKDYPMDSQSCKLQITMYRVLIHWLDDADDFLKSNLGSSASMLKGVKPLQFSTGKLVTRKRYREIVKGLNTTILSCEFVFTRHLTASLINTYIPSFLVVSLSMVSFWLDVSAVPGRVTLGVTAMLTLATEIVHARSCLPPVDYMTAMDIWLFGCLVMVFLSLIEFTVAHSIHRKPNLWPQPVVSIIHKLPVINAWTTSKHKDKDKEKENPKSKDKKTESKETEESNQQKEFRNSFSDHYTPTYKKDNILDRVSRVVFPCSMLLFSSVYWLHYVIKKGL